MIPAIEALIPHAGPMRLIDAIVAFDETTARATATSHREATHPLRLDGTLPGLCAVEYAAQAMAAHGALCARPGEAAPGAGYIASVRDVVIAAPRLDTLGAVLDIMVERLSAAGLQVMYRFEVASDGVLAASGRATVVLQGAPTP